MKAWVLGSRHQSHVGGGVSGALVYEVLLLLPCLAGNMCFNGGSSISKLLGWGPSECNCFAPNKFALCNLNYRAELEHHRSFDGH